MRSHGTKYNLKKKICECQIFRKYWSEVLPRLALFPPRMTFTLYTSSIFWSTGPIVTENEWKKVFDFNFPLMTYSGLLWLIIYLQKAFYLLVLSFEKQ